MAMAMHIIAESFNIKECQAIKTFLVHCKNNEVTEYDSMLEAVNAKLDEYFAPRIDVKDEDGNILTGPKEIGWGRCESCDIALHYKGTKEMGVLECPKCFYSKPATADAAHRVLTEYEVGIFIHRKRG